MYGGDNVIRALQGHGMESALMDNHRPLVGGYNNILGQDRSQHGSHPIPVHFIHNYDVVFSPVHSQAFSSEEHIPPPQATYETMGREALDEMIRKEMNGSQGTMSDDSGGCALYYDDAEVSNVFDMVDDIDVDDEERMLMDSLENNDIVISDALGADPDMNFDYILENDRISPSLVLEKAAAASSRACHLESFPQMRLASEQHYGNNRFYIQLLLHRQKFLEAYHEKNSPLCDKIAKHVINLVSTSFPRGRFLEYVPSRTHHGSLTDIGYGYAAMQRVKSCLFHLPTVGISKYFSPKTFMNGAPSSRLMDDDGKLKLENRSNTVTMQTILSKTMSMTSDRDDCGYEVTSLRTGSFVAQGHMKYDPDNASYSPSNDHKKKKKGLRRRGLLSSDVPSKNSRFQISSDLEKLVRNVFDRPIEDKGGEDSDDEDCSGYSSASEDVRPTQRRRSMASHSMCSSTSSLAGLGGDFSNTLKIDTWQKGTASKTQRRRKNTPARASKLRNDVITQPELYSDFKVKVMDDSNGSLLYRSLTSYDILCNLDDRPKILLCNHIGNNRLRILLQMHQARFNARNSPLANKNRLVHDIIQNTLHSDKGTSNYVFQDPDNVNYWVQIPVAFVPKLIVSCLEDCRQFIELPMLPLITTKPWVKSLMGNQGVRHQTMEDLHETALKNIRKRKQKKTISGRDKGSIAMLQNSVVINTVVIEETTRNQ